MLSYLPGNRFHAKAFDPPLTIRGIIQLHIVKIGLALILGHGLQVKT